jgi:hypothetical protein
MVSISRCGCIKDPDLDRHRCSGEGTEKMVDAAAAAAQHLLAENLTPVFDVSTLRALWRAGHRDLAVELAEHWRLAG